MFTVQCSGESAFTTIAPVVLGDLFTDDTRSLVYGIFYMGIQCILCSLLGSPCALLVSTFREAL